MIRFSRWCFVHRKIVLTCWLLILVSAVALSAATGSRFNSNASLPNTDSQAALSLLRANFPTASGEGDQIVFQTKNDSTVESPKVKAAVTQALDKLAHVHGVESVVSPYGPGGSAQISKGGTIEFATVTWAKAASDVTITDAQHLMRAAESADGAAVHVSLGGQSISNEERASPGLSVVVGVAAALVILLIVLGGALLAAFMPLLSTVMALIIGTGMIGLVSHAFSVPKEATDLALLIGLGVGVDYGLFIVSRHRSGIKAGLSYEEAAVQALNTSGRTVLFAGTTVCIALLGQLFLGVSFLNGLSVSSAIAVALTMATSLTLLPALLGFLGPKVLSRRERRALENASLSSDVSHFWLRWATFVEMRKGAVALGSLAVLAIVALPILGLRLGSSDASTDPSSSSTHQAYVALAQGFGPGFNGPLELVAQSPTPRDKAAFDRLLTTLAHTHGVTSVTTSNDSPDDKVAVATVYPSSGPQAARTVSLVSTLRNDLIPQAERGTTLAVHVGGVTATDIDFSRVLTNKLPLFIAIVVVLAFILLMAVFRSLLIPLVASLMNILSIGAALGAMNAVFNWGWGSSIFRISGTGPIDAFLPVLMFSVLFGLSMDYEVYLISRMQEEWRRLRSQTHPSAAINARAAWRNHEAIVMGQAKSGRIIAAAAAVMVLVFGSFMLGGERSLKEFGFGLGFSVLVDVLVIRSLLMPALMHIIGPANWSMPKWLDRILPDLSVVEVQSTPSAPEAPVVELESALHA